VANTQPNSVYRFFTGIKDKLLKSEPSDDSFQRLKSMTLYLEKHLKYISTVQKNKKELSEEIRTILADPANRLFTSKKEDHKSLEEKQAIRSCLGLKEGLFDIASNDLSSSEKLVDMLTLCKVLQYNITPEFNILSYFNLERQLALRLRSIVFR
jgi:hypothetical protein